MTSGKTILLIGQNGMVGNALGPTLRGLGNLVAIGRKDVDLSDADALADVVRAIRPGVIVNAAAYTAVDKAENDQAMAFAVNATACEVLAHAANDIGAALVHYSTDYVFDGKKTGWYVEDDQTAPLSVYGATKLEGEMLIRAHMRKAAILRTSWVFSAHGSNFLKTILRLARERDEINIVMDQFGAPTSAAMIADVTSTLVEQILTNSDGFSYGTYHLAAGGEASWHAYASYAIDYARKLNMPMRANSAAVKPIPASAYPTAAARPKNSRLNTAKLRNQFAVDLPPWEAGVRKAIELLASS